MKTYFHPNIPLNNQLSNFDIELDISSKDGHIFRFMIVNILIYRSIIYLLTFMIQKLVKIVTFNKWFTDNFMVSATKMLLSVLLIGLNLSTHKKDEKQKWDLL